MQIVQGQALVTRNGRFIYPQGQEIKPLELTALINYNSQNLVPQYRENMNMYLSKHDILNAPTTQTGLNNRLVANLPKYIVDTYGGYFLGIPPKITLNSAGDENDQFQKWLTSVSFVDKLTEISKQADIYGRSYGFLYQKEDASTGFTYVSPTKSFMIYDDTVEHAPLAFVRYEYLTNQSEYQSHGFIYYADKVIEFVAGHFVGENINPYKLVPAVEFFENEEREGVFDSVKTLVNALDRGVSQKANQIEYFDNAYLSIIGLHLPTDKNGNIKMNFKTNRVLYAPQVDPNSKPDIKFISKPDADTMQENYLNRLTNLIYQISMVPNLNDINFSGTASGIALKYKYLSMQMKASEKERKFTKALRQLFQIVFSTGQVLPLQDANDWQNLTFSFTRNVPDDVPGAIDAAKDATGIVSHRTQLKLLPFVNDADNEINQIGKEKADQIKQARASMGDLMDSDQDETND